MEKMICVESKEEQEAKEAVKENDSNEDKIDQGKKETQYVIEKPPVMYAQAKESKLFSQAVEEKRHSTNVATTLKTKEENVAVKLDKCVNVCNDKLDWNADIPKAKIPSLGDDVALYMAHVVSPTSFYALIIDEDMGKQDVILNTELKELNDIYTNYLLPPAFSKVLQGSCWAAKVAEDNTWYRVRVLEKIQKRNSNDKILVQYVDYGNVEWVDTKRLRPLTKTHSLLPCFVCHFSLSHVFPLIANESDDKTNPAHLNWSSEATKQFLEKIFEVNNVVINGKVKNISKTNEEWPVSLELNIHFENQANLCLNKYLVDCGLAKSEFYSIDASDAKSDCNSSLCSWDPMSEDFNSTLNSYAIDDSHPGVATTGYKGNDENRICRSFNRTNKCKNPFCRREHIKTDMSVTSDVQTVHVNLDSQVKYVECGRLLAIKVTAIFTPARFYVNFPYGIEDIEKQQREATSKRKVKAMEDFDALRKNLASFYTNKPRKHNPNILFTCGEMVATKVCDEWNRAKVLEVDEANNKMKVECVDYGDEINVDERDVFPLDLKFCLLPWQAVECFLWKVKAVHNWTKDSLEWFEQIIDEPYLVALVEDIQDDILFITLTTKDDVCINEELIRLGFAERADYF